MRRHAERPFRAIQTIGGRSLLFAILGGGGYLIIVFILEFCFTPPFVSPPTFSGFGFLVYYMAFVGAIAGAATFIADKYGILCWLPSLIVLCWVAYSLEGEFKEQFDVYDTTCFGQIVVSVFLFVCGVAVYVNERALDNKEVGTTLATPPKDE